MTKQFTRGDIDALAQRYRANLINSLSGFKSATLVGTTNGDTNNLAIVALLCRCKPPRHDHASTYRHARYVEQYKTAGLLYAKSRGC